jgi:16S rRNA (guanine966-N2)-methyltransferase
MKIIAGKYKSRNINAPMDIRPVSMRVKEACFDLLGGEMDEMRVLDLFAGSGSLGLEAYSRGASDVVFVDSQKKCTEAIGNNISLLGIEPKPKIYLKDSFLALEQLNRVKERFDLVFLDPPYYKGMLTKSLQALREYDILARFGFAIGFCYIKDEFFVPEDVFSLVTNRKYGQTTIVIYQNKEI